MWPFSILSSNEKNMCPHQWEPYERSITHGKKILFEDGQPVLYRIVVNGDECIDCGETKNIESNEEIIYLSVERVEHNEIK